MIFHQQKLRKFKEMSGIVAAAVACVFSLVAFCQPATAGNIYQRANGSPDLARLTKACGTPPYSVNFNGVAAQGNVQVEQAAATKLLGKLSDKWKAVDVGSLSGDARLQAERVIRGVSAGTAFTDVGLNYFCRLETYYDAANNGAGDAAKVQAVQDARQFYIDLLGVAFDPENFKSPTAHAAALTEMKLQAKQLARAIKSTDAIAIIGKADFSSDFHGQLDTELKSSAGVSGGLCIGAAFASTATFNDAIKTRLGSLGQFISYEVDGQASLIASSMMSFGTEMFNTTPVTGLSATDLVCVKKVADVAKANVANVTSAAASSTSSSASSSSDAKQSSASSSSR